MSQKQKNELELIATMQEALDSEVGLELEFFDEKDMKTYRQKLYNARRNHPEYQCLAMKDMGDKLWIIKQQYEDHDEET